VYMLLSITEICDLRVSVVTYVSPKGSLQCKRFRNTQHNYGYIPRASNVVAPKSPVFAQHRGRNLSAVAAEPTTHLVTWTVQSALVKRAPEGVRKIAATSFSAAPKAQRAVPSAKQRDLSKRWNHVIRGGLCC
jgi:hypothetical protein